MRIRLTGAPTAGPALTPQSSHKMWIYHHLPYLTSHHHLLSPIPTVSLYPLIVVSICLSQSWNKLNTQIMGSLRAYRAPLPFIRRTIRVSATVLQRQERWLIIATGEHYRSDHHRYNMKRRVAGLSPVSAEIFDQKVLDRRAETAIMASAKGSFCEVCK